jgi:predicted nuclease of predicted toxin-antitoxin system
LKLLFDQNLSPSLVERLQDLFPGSVHVKDVHLERAPDYLVWEYARDHSLCIVTQDADFADQVVLDGFPPKVLWLRTGNSSTKQLEATLRKHASKIREFEPDSEAGVLIIRK